jgi:hypothetical protein
VICSAAFVILPSFAGAQTTDNTENVALQPPPGAQIDKRIFGVLPNYRTADGSAPYQPITTRHKYYIAAKDTFDYPVYLLAGAFAGLYQWQDENPSFGQGAKGYAKRIASSYADQAIGNMMTEAVLPSLLHEDPRYFRIGAGSGSNWHRTRYALTRVMMVRTDKDTWRFNYSEWLGNGATVAFSNLYYPSDTRNLEDNIQKLGVQVGTDAISQVLKEFWPDWKRHLFKKKS